MIYKNITFKAAPFSYDLTFDDRIILVGGDSGTGKTVLYEMLEDIRLTDEYKAITLKWNFCTIVIAQFRNPNFFQWRVAHLYNSMLTICVSHHISK